MELKAQAAEEAAQVEHAMREDLGILSASMDPLLIEILEYGLFSGGKRIRPFLVIQSARLCGTVGPEVYKLAAAFEYLHAATLYHDDVIDKAATRRGQLSVNKRYGTVGAILAGDFLHAHAMAIVGKYAGLNALAVFTRATRGMVDGEFVQLRNSRNFSQSEADYFNVVMGKTALLIGAACEVGCIYAGGDETQQAALGSYGRKLGCAFQIVDDLLDYLGDSGTTGKEIGNDLVEGKMTLPLILALDSAAADDREALSAIIADPRLRAESVAEVKELINRNSGFAASRTKAEEIVNEAIAALHVFSPDKCPHSRALLHDLAHYVLNRKS